MAKEVTVPKLRSYSSLKELLLDKDLAGLGDSYVNFVYSLAMSHKHKRPIGQKVNNQTLAKAVELSGVRRCLPHRVDRHMRGNAAEALLVFAWVQDKNELTHSIKVLSEKENSTEAFAVLLREILEKLGVSNEDKYAHEY
jgi:hypothetical protein